MMERSYKELNVRNEIIREKMGVRQIVVEDYKTTC
jgi:hypothetical protein